MNIFKNSFYKIMVLCVMVLLMLPISVSASSSNNLLADVKFSVGSLNTQFSPNVINYDLTVPTGTTFVDATAVASDASATVSIGGENLATGKIVITVKAANGARKYYTFFIKYSDSIVTTTTSTTTTTTITTPDATSSSAISGEEPEVTTSDTLDSSDTSKDSTLDLLSIKNYRFTSGFSTRSYEYTVLVDELSTEYEVEYITTSANAEVNITKNTDRYVVEVVNDENKSVYVINFRLRGEGNSIDETSRNYTVIRNSLFAILLMMMSIMLYILSKKLSK